MIIYRIIGKSLSIIVAIAKIAIFMIQNKQNKYYLYKIFIFNKQLNFPKVLAQKVAIS